MSKQGLIIVYVKIEITHLIKNQWFKLIFSIIFTSKQILILFYEKNRYLSPFFMSKQMKMSSDLDQWLVRPNSTSTKQRVSDPLAAFRKMSISSTESSRYRLMRLIKKIRQLTNKKLKIVRLIVHIYCTNCSKT